MKRSRHPVDLAASWRNSNAKLKGVLKATEDGAWSDTVKAMLRSLEACNAELAAKIKLPNALAALLSGCVRKPPIYTVPRWPVLSRR